MIQKGLQLELSTPVKRGVLAWSSSPLIVRGGAVEREWYSFIFFLMWEGQLESEIEWKVGESKQCKRQRIWLVEHMYVKMDGVSLITGWLFADERADVIVNRRWWNTVVVDSEETISVGPPPPTPSRKNWIWLDQIRKEWARRFTSPRAVNVKENSRW